MKTKFSTFALTLLCFAFIVWMIVQADLNHRNFIMNIGHSVPFGDKIGHFSLFGLLALLLNMALKFKQITICKRHFHLGSVIVLTFASCEEFSQLAFSTRTFDLMDMLFDLLGIVVLSSIGFRKFIVERLKEFTDHVTSLLMVK